jgi:hypothetical protein
MTEQWRREDKAMVPILVILTVIACIGIRSLAQRIRTHAAEERKVRRSPWILTEEAFSKC